MSSADVARKPRIFLAPTPASSSTQSARGVDEDRQNSIQVEIRPWSQTPTKQTQPAVSSASSVGSHPTQPHVSDALAMAVNASPAIIDEFSTQVAVELTHGILRQSQRKMLIRQATKLGIGAFEANLLIAAVEHRNRGLSPSGPAVNAQQKPTPAGYSWVVAVALVLVEAAILLTIAKS